MDSDLWNAGNDMPTQLPLLKLLHQRLDDADHLSRRMSRMFPMKRGRRLGRSRGGFATLQQTRSIAAQYDDAGVQFAEGELVKEYLQQVCARLGFVIGIVASVCLV